MPDLTDAGRDARIMGYLRLAETLSLDVGHWSLSHDDLVQEASVAIIRAIDAWDATKAPLDKYVQCCIRWALKNAVRRATRATRRREDADVTKPSSN